LCYFRAVSPAAPSREEIATKLRGFFDREPVTLVVLFGSVARGTAREDSDVDLGIIASGELAEELNLQARLERHLGRSIDLVRLDLANPLLRWRAAREGVVLHANPPSEAARFLARAAIEHDEMAPVIDAATRVFMARRAQRVQ
jgi:predicted nucleotidyltransferase